MAENNSSHCQQERVIAGINSDVNTVKDDVTEVKGAFKDMLSEFRELTKDLRESLLDGREMKVEVQTLKRDMDIAFSEVRENTRSLRALEDTFIKETDKLRSERVKHCEKVREEYIRPLETWKTKVEERFSMFKVIPVACTVIVALLTIYNFTHQAVATEPAEHYAQGPGRAVMP